MPTYYPSSIDGTLANYVLSGYNFGVEWCSTCDKIRLQVEVPENHWFAVGFGYYMVDTDMIVWQNYPTTTQTTDLWSTANIEPVADTD